MYVVRRGGMSSWWHVDVRKITRSRSSVRQYLIVAHPGKAEAGYRSGVFLRTFTRADVVECEATGDKKVLADEKDEESSKHLHFSRQAASAGL